MLVVKKELLKFQPDELEMIRTLGEENIAGIAALVVIVGAAGDGGASHIDD